MFEVCPLKEDEALTENIKISCSQSVHYNIEVSLCHSVVYTPAIKDKTVQCFPFLVFKATMLTYLVTFGCVVCYNYWQNIENWLTVNIFKTLVMGIYYLIADF